MTTRAEVTWFYQTVRLLATIATFAWFRLEIRGVEHIPPSGPFILAANHASFIDPVLLGVASYRRLYYLMAVTIYRLPLLHWLVRHLGAIPVRGASVDRAAVETALGLLRRGCGVVIFPEGARSHDGLLRDPQRGVGLLAARSRAPVVPAAIEGSYRAYPPGRRIPRPSKIILRFGPPLRFPIQARGGSRPLRRELQAEFASEVMASVAGLLGGAGGDRRTVDR